MFPIMISGKANHLFSKGDSRHVFLIGDEPDYLLSRQIAKDLHIEKPTILTCSSEAPYLTNDMLHLAGVSSWEDMGIGDLTISRYWLDHYREIDQAVLWAIADNPSLVNEVTMGDYFRLDLVLSVGQDFLEPVKGLSAMLVKTCPKALFVTRNRSLITHAAFSLAKHYGIVCRELR